MLKMKSMLMNGMFRNIQSVLYSKLFLSKQFSIKVPEELQYVEKSVFMKKVNARNIWMFELRTQETFLSGIL